MKAKYLFRLVWSASLGGVLVGTVTSYLLLSGHVQPRWSWVTWLWPLLTVGNAVIGILALRAEFRTKKDKSKS